MSLDLDVRPITAAEAKAIVLPNHYSGTWNTAFGKINFGIFDGDELRGAAVHPLAVIARCQVICEAQGDPRAHKFMDYLRRSVTADEVFGLLDAAHENEWVAAEVARNEAEPRLFDFDVEGSA